MAEPLTKERESEIRRMLTDIGPPKHEDAIGDLLAEIDRLRALPVLRTCGECAHCVTDLHVGEWCDRDEQQRDTESESPPPEWCPLRGAR